MGITSDGVVSITSQLRLIRQERTDLVRDYNEDHVSILENENVAILINEILEQHLK